MKIVIWIVCFIAFSALEAATGMNIILVNILYFAAAYGLCYLWDEYFG